MEPIDYVRALLRRWPIIAVGALIGAIIAFVTTDPAVGTTTETTYRATHTLLANSGQQAVGTITFAQVPVFATTGEVPRRVAEGLGYSGNPASLAAQVTVSVDPSTGVVQFTTYQADADQAVRIADGFADETVSYLAERQEQVRQERKAAMLASVDELEQEINTLDEQLREEAATSASGSEVDSVTRAQRDAVVREYSTAYEAYRALIAEEDEGINLTTLERAQAVQVQSGGFSAPRTRASRVPIAAAVGAALGAAVALLAERLDARLRDRTRAEEAFGATVVGEIPSMTRRQRKSTLVVGPEFHHGVSESFRSLRTSVTFIAAGGQPLADDDAVGVVLIASPSPAEGKTTVSVNLAAAFAETGRSVVVVNADFRRPAIAAVLLSVDRQRLPAGLGGIGRLAPTEFLVETSIARVRLLDLAPLSESPGDLTRATVRLVAALRTEVDVIVIDTPPLSITTEALEFVPSADVVVIVGRIGRTTVEPAKRAGELVRFGGAEQVAAVLTDSGSSRLRRSHYYNYYGRRGPVDRSPAIAPASSTPLAVADEGLDPAADISNASDDIDIEIDIDDDDPWERLDEMLAAGDAPRPDDQTA